LGRQREALGITEEQIAADIEELHKQHQAIRVEAIFEDGVLRPLGDVPLYEGERVSLTIEPHDDDLDHAYFAQCQAEVAKSAKPALTPEECQELLKDDKSCWADLIIQERGEY